VQILVSDEAVSRIRQGGGLLFVRRRTSRGPRLVLTVLEATLDPPNDAFDFDRFANPSFMLFVDPKLRPLPEELWIDVRESNGNDLLALWNGIAFVA
jgi:hypothetical protein